MSSSPVVQREWTHEVAFDEVQIRCRYVRQGQVILQYTVQLEMRHLGIWQPVVRYDNAHGFCHCDTIHADGSQEKTLIDRAGASANFTWAIKELRADWQSQRNRFLTEFSS